MTGPLAEAATAADDLDQAATAPMRLSAVAQKAQALADALASAHPPTGDRSSTSAEEAMTNLYDQVIGWRKYYDKPHIQTTDQLQRLEYADFLQKPLSWVRANCSPTDVRRWADHQPIKQDRMDEQIQSGGD